MQSLTASCREAVVAGSALKVPAAQAVHSVAVVVVEYLPAAQIAQLWPETYWPAVHVVGVTVQLALPATLVLPVAQALQSFAPTILEAVVAGSAR